MKQNPAEFSPKQWKKLHRQQNLEKRQSLAQEDCQQLSTAIQKNLLNHLSHLENIDIISFYWPFKGEPDLRPLMKNIASEGTRMALPVVAEKNTPLRFMAWQPGDPLKKGVLNIPIPEKETPVIPDVILAPAIGFDRQLYRLGYGGGYFDRTLATFKQRPEGQKPHVIGIAHSAAELSTIHPEPHDIKLDVIITEKAIIEGKRF